jgi:hypothetical protein
MRGLCSAANQCDATDWARFWVLRRRADHFGCGFGAANAYAKLAPYIYGVSRISTRFGTTVIDLRQSLCGTLREERTSLRATDTRRPSRSPRNCSGDRHPDKRLRPRVQLGSFRDHLTRKRRPRSQGYRHGSNVPKEDVRDHQQASHLISADQIPIRLLTNFSKNVLRLQGSNKKVLTGKWTELARLTSEFVDNRSKYGFAPKSIQGDVSCC